jgi:hypothetical protein
MAAWMIPAAIIGSSLLGSRSASKAADVQAAAANRAAELQNEQFQQTRQDFAPYRAAGEQALNKLIPLSDYTKFGMDQFQQDPGYAFRLSEGQKTLDRSAAARGGLISGAALKAAGRYGQEMGSQEYQNAFNRYQTERNAMLNPLQSLAGIGQTTTQQLGQFGAANAANVGNAYGAAGQAAASGYMGQANAISGGLGQYMNYNQNQAQNSLLQRVLQNRGSFYGGPTTNFGGSGSGTFGEGDY